MTFPICGSDSKLGFEQNGYLHVKNFFDPDVCLAICKALNSIDPSAVMSIPVSRSTFAQPSDLLDAQYSGLTYLQKASLFIPEICGIKNLPLLKYSADLLSVEDAFYLEDEVHVRQPFSAHEIPAHQDNFYFALQNPIALTCYVYLTKQECNSGGLGFLAANITSSTDEHDASSAIGFSSYNKFIESDQKESFHYPSTGPGDVVFHHSNTYHRAFPNATSFATASLSIRVFSTSNLSKSKMIQEKYSANLRFNRF